MSKTLNYEFKVFIQYSILIRRNNFRMVQHKCKMPLNILVHLAGICRKFEVERGKNCLKNLSLRSG